MRRRRAASPGTSAGSGKASIPGEMAEGRFGRREDLGALAEQRCGDARALGDASISDRLEQSGQRVQRPALADAAARRDADRRALRGHHAHTGRVGASRHLGDEARLSDPALARDERDAAAAFGEAGQHGDDTLERGAPPDDLGTIKVRFRLESRRWLVALADDARKDRGHVVGVSDPIARVALQETEHDEGGVELGRHALGEP